MERRHLIQWVPQISFGNVISFTTIIALVSVQWGFNNARMTGAEDRLTRLELNTNKLNNDVHSIDVQITLLNERQQNLLKQQEKAQALLVEVHQQVQIINKLQNDKRISP